MAYAELLEEEEKIHHLRWLRRYLIDIGLTENKKYKDLYQELKALQ
jgi:hypothetical protein